MIYKGTLLLVNDNSGGKVAKCLHNISKKKSGNLGDLILVTLYKYVFGKKVKKKVFYLGLIVCLKY
jgi:ribosomal protein L14